VRTNIRFWSYLAQFFKEWELFQTQFIEKIKIHLMINTFFSTWHLLWDNGGKNIVRPDKPQMTIWRVRIACWIPNATNILSECVILITFPLQQWLHERASLLPYTYTDCLVNGWIKIDQLHVTCFIISLFNAQHVSNVSISILRSLRLICWVISCIVLLWFDVCWCYGVVWLGWCGILMQVEALVLQSA